MLKARRHGLITYSISTQKKLQQRPQHPQHTTSSRTNTNTSSSTTNTHYHHYHQYSRLTLTLAPWTPAWAISSSSSSTQAVLSLTTTTTATTTYTLYTHLHLHTLHHYSQRLIVKYYAQTSTHKQCVGWDIYYFKAKANTPPAKSCRRTTPLLWGCWFLCYLYNRWCGCRAFARGGNNNDRGVVDLGGSELQGLRIWQSTCTNHRNRGRTSTDRSTKATLMLTVPRSIIKSSTKDLT